MLGGYRSIAAFKDLVSKVLAGRVFYKKHTVMKILSEKRRMFPGQHISQCRKIKHRTDPCILSLPMQNKVGELAKIKE